MPASFRSRRAPFSADSSLSLLSPFTSAAAVRLGDVIVVAPPALQDVIVVAPPTRRETLPLFRRPAPNQHKRRPSLCSAGRLHVASSWPTPAVCSRNLRRAAAPARQPAIDRQTAARYPTGTTSDGGRRRTVHLSCPVRRRRLNSGQWRDSRRRRWRISRPKLSDGSSSRWDI